MAKDRKKLIHIHSSIPDKQPSPQSLEVGEIAVNNAANQEFLSIKNSEDKVKRFSSDEQLITWMEKKEVMPYVGYVRGGAGPSATSAETPTADSYGSYGIQTSDLTGNTSEIVIKLNQVAASATTKHNRVNGSKDRYNKDVNPTTDGGVNDGAGFFIDMSRYAMQGANPTFSGITNTCYTNLNGTTKIKGVNGACGSLLDITVNSAKTDVETANTEITSATTVIGTNTTTISGNTTLSVSGTTTETKKGNVTEHNLANKSETTDVNLTELVKGNNYRDVNGSYSGTTGGTTTEVKTKAVSETNLDTTSIVRHSGVTEDNKSNVVRTTSGTTTETFKGQVTENNQSGYTVNTTGNTTFNTTGTTTIQSTGDGSDVVVYAKDDLCATSDDVAAFKGANTTNIGSDCTNANQTKTLNVRANNADTRVTSAYTSATTATTIIGTANTSATTADYSGNTLSSHVKGLTHSGDTLNVTESTSTTIKSPTTTISGCTKIDLVSDDLNFKSCTSAGTIDFDFCNGFNVNSNAVKFEQCSTAGTFTIKEKGTSISGETLTIRESGATDFSGNTLTTTTAGNTNVNVGGNLTEKVTGNTSITSTGTTTLSSTETTTIEATGANSDVCISATDSARVYGKGSTYVGVNCAGTPGSATTVEGTTLVLSGNTTNISGATTLNLSGKIVNVDATDIDVDASNNYCVSAATKANFYGKATNIGIECGGTTATSVNVSGTTINEGGTTLNQNFQDYDINASKTYCVSAATNANFYGKTTNVGVDCGGTTATTINVSGTTINEGGKNITINTTEKTCITAGSDLNLGGVTNTRLGYNCDGTGISNNTNIFASTAVTINAPVTNITGDTYLSGSTYFHKTCTGLTNNEIDAAFCEVLSRGAVSMDVTSNPAPGILKRYTIKQNGANISGTANGVIDVPKDFLLKSAAVVYGNASADRTSFTACTGTQTNCHWYIELVFNVKDGTSEESRLYLEEDDFIKDITDNNPSGVVADSSYNNVAVKVEYDGKKNVVSATTTPTIHAKENIYADGTVSGATVSGTSTSAGTLTVTGNTTLKGTTATTLSATSVTSPTISGTNITASAAIRANNVSANTISANTRINTANLYATDTVSGTNVSAQTINATSAMGSPVISGTNINGVSINGTNISGTTVKGDTISGTNITASNKVTTNALDTNGNVNLSNIVTIDTAAGQCVTINRNLCVNGVVTAQQQIYSSDRNLKENINLVTDEEMDKISAIQYKSYNFKDDESKNILYGVIAQEVQEAGLGELVYSKEDGMLAVDYTSLMMLKLAALTRSNDNLVAFISNLDNRMAKLEARNKELESKIEELEGKKDQ